MGGAEPTGSAPSARPWHNCAKLPLDTVRKLAHDARMETDLIGAAEAAEILGVSVATVNRMAANGTLPTAAKLHGRTGAHIFNRATVEAKRVAA